MTPLATSLRGGVLSVVVSQAALVTSACVFDGTEEEGCPRRTGCPSITLNRQVLAPDAGSSSFSFGGSLESYPLGTLDPMFHPATCQAWIGGIKRNAASSHPEELALACSSSDGRSFVLITEIPDPRKLSVGSFEGSDGDAVSSYTDACLVDGSCDFRCSLCRMEPLEGSVVVTVETAVGGPAALPKVVTDDFRRVIVVDYQFSEPVQGSHDPCKQMGPCTGTVFIQGSLRFEIHAGDYVADLDDVCPC